jgi:voltage-gated potassium channel
MADDRENLLTVFEARHLNPAVRIVSRLVSDDAHQRLLRAGADSIVPMQRIGALRLASEILRPHVVSVLDQMLREPGQMRVQQIPVGLAGAGKTLSSLRLQEQAGVIIFAIRQSGSLRHVFNPAPDTVIEEGDVLIGCAEPDQLETARQLAGSGSRPANSS